MASTASAFEDSEEEGTERALGDPHSNLASGLSYSMVKTGNGSIKYFHGDIEKCCPFPGQMRMTSWFNPANRSLNHEGGVAGALKRRFPKTCDWEPSELLPDGTVVQQTIRDSGSYGEIIHCCYSDKNSPDRLTSAFYDENDEKYLYRIMQEGALTAKHTGRVITLFGDGSFQYSRKDCVRALIRLLQNHKSCEWVICCPEAVMEEIEKALVCPEPLYPDLFLRPAKHLHTPCADVAVHIPTKTVMIGMSSRLVEGPRDTSLEAQNSKQAEKNHSATPGNVPSSFLGLLTAERQGDARYADSDTGIRQNTVVLKDWKYPVHITQLQLKKRHTQDGDGRP